MVAWLLECWYVGRLEVIWIFDVDVHVHVEATWGGFLAVKRVRGEGV